MLTSDKLSPRQRRKVVDRYVSQVRLSVANGLPVRAAYYAMLAYRLGRTLMPTRGGRR